MSSAKQTLERYKAVCREEKVKPASLVLNVLRMLHDVSEDINLRAARTPDGAARLHLAGNNHLMCDPATGRLGDDDVLDLYKTLQNNFLVRILDLRYNNITDIGAKHLGKLLTENMTIEALNLMCNDIGEEGAEHIAKALHTNETLVSLRITGNKIGRQGGMSFAQALQVNETLAELDLCQCDLSIDPLIALSTVLNYNNALRVLNVGRPVLFTQQEEPTVHMSRMLQVNKGLSELHMEKYGMTDFGAARLAEALIDNFTLKYLNLASNRITRDGVRELCHVLKKNTNLAFLDLSNNRVEGPGASHLADALSTYNTKLTTLVLTNNKIDGDGLCALADMLKFNATLNCLYIWGNQAEEKACIALGTLLETGRLLAKDVDFRPYTVDGIMQLAQVYQQPRRHYYAGPFYGGDIPEEHLGFASYIREMQRLVKGSEESEEAGVINEEDDDEGDDTETLETAVDTTTEEPTTSLTDTAVT